MSLCPPKLSTKMPSSAGNGKVGRQGGGGGGILGVFVPPKAAGGHKHAQQRGEGHAPAAEVGDSVHRDLGVGPQHPADHEGRGGPQQHCQEDAAGQGYPQAHGSQLGGLQ